jgi:hypothetical protein
MQSTQESRILSALEQGQMISPLGAWRRFGCERLAARIYDLRRKGYRIERAMVKLPSGARVAEYWIDRK